MAVRGPDSGRCQWQPATRVVADALWSLVLLHGSMMGLVTKILQPGWQRLVDILCLGSFQTSDDLLSRFCSRDSVTEFLSVEL